MEIEFKKMNDNAVLPSYATSGSVGMDLTSVSHEFDPDTETYTYDTGLAMKVPDGCVGAIFPRSSVYKTSLSLANAVGIIDQDYIGNIKAKFRTVEHVHQPVYNDGDRVAQLVILPVIKGVPTFVDGLDETDRGTGGFGSTGA